MKVFASPSRYIQGKNALFTNAKTLKQLGNSPILLCDDVVYGIVGERFESYLIDNGMTPVHVAFNGEASDNEISRVVAIAKENGNDVIIGLGGGKTIDSAKAIADLLAVPVIIAPTIASTDAPTSALSVIYTDEGAFEKYIFYSKNPDLVLVDTQVICQAPKRLLASGIADGLATWVEARAVMQKNGDTMAGGNQTLAGVAIAKACEQTLFAAISTRQYNWNNILPTYSGRESNVQKMAISELMADVGISVDMDYGPSSGSVGSSRVQRALKENFGYNQSVHQINRSDFSKQDWESQIDKELSQNQPVYYQGVGKVGGHAFVIDGADGRNFYHVNWGWGGVSDGFFRLDALNPSALGTGGGAGGFNGYQSAVVGIKP